jgi:hypothetical protein
MDSYLPTPAALAKAVPTMSAAAMKEWAPELSPSAAPAPVAQPEAEAAPEAHCHKPGAEPKVELVRMDGRITKVIVTCRCGERMALDCEYDA